MEVTVKLKQILLAMLVSGVPTFALANDPFYVTFSGSLRYATIHDYTDYLGPAGSTNPTYAIGLDVFDYLGDAPQPDGTYAYEQNTSIEADVSDEILVVAAYDPAGPVSEFVNPWNGALHRSTYPPEGNTSFSLNINVLGQSFSLHRVATRASASSVTYSPSSASNQTTLELLYNVGDDNPAPGVYE